MPYPRDIITYKKWKSQGSSRTPKREGTDLTAVSKGKPSGVEHSTHRPTGTGLHIWEMGNGFFSRKAVRLLISFVYGVRPLTYGTDRTTVPYEVRTRRAPAPHSVLAAHPRGGCRGSILNTVTNGLPTGLQAELHPLTTILHVQNVEHITLAVR